MKALNNYGIVELINGPVVKGTGMSDFKVNEMVTVGERQLIGEVVSLDGDVATVQVYEETEGLKAGEHIISTGAPLSLTLGPGMLSNMFDGIQRPLKKIQTLSADFIPEGIGLLSLDEDKEWDVVLTVATSPSNETTSPISCLSLMPKYKRHKVYCTRLWYLQILKERL